VIEVKNLHLSFAGAKVLEDISFRLESGENLIILGRSGAGKTVLIKAMLGLFQPDRGSVTVDGMDVYSRDRSKRDEIRQLFSMVFQNAALLDSFSVFQNVALPLYERRNLEYGEVLEKVRKSLAVVGLEDTLDKFPSELSGGMRKRVGIARALVYDPRYIIFDEPVSGLDPITASEVLYYITQIIRSVQATTITITHDIRNLRDIGDRVLFLDKGRALFFGTLDQMDNCPDPLLRQFMD